MTRRGRNTRFKYPRIGPPEHWQAIADSTAAGDGRSTRDGRHRLESDPEAARAVTAAMPLLSIAKQIIIATVAEDETAFRDDGAARLLASLRWHGFPVSMRRLDPGPGGPAETLLGATREETALLVMGGYGHSRLREWVFGGFTQQILSGADIPVLMAH